MTLSRVGPTSLRSAVVLTAILAHAATAQSSHIVVREPFRKGAVTNAAVDGRLTAAAVHYAGVANIPRIALFDVAYPADSNELRRLHGYALLVITAVTHDSSELPLRRIYLRKDGATAPLHLMSRVLSRVQDTCVASTFGTFREDVVLLVPVQAPRAETELLVDFAAHREGFRVTVFDDDVPPLVASYRALRMAPGEPARADVQKLLQREFPDLAASIAR